ncbi:MAG: type VI secretion system baseplate subunit TssG [Planctomycetes bacterium]|nr:type VI secretion system baseplate subunit TssG [Planctomycetota bacterium]
MAAEARWTDAHVIRDLLERGSKYSFFQAVHAIQKAFPQAPRVGHQGPPDQEVLRFLCTRSLGFASADIESVRPAERPDGGPRIELTTAFLGVFGAGSPLPTYYTEDLHEPDAEASLIPGFVDLFHHRLVSLLYRVWEKYRYAIQFQAGGADRISRRLLVLAGLGADIVPSGVVIPPIRLLAYLGLLAQNPHSAAALRGILADYFSDVSVAVQQCVERPLEIVEEERNRLGKRATELGVNLTLGSRIPDRTATFRIHLGPVDFATYLSFLPPGPNTARLEAITDLFNIDALQYELEVRLRREEAVPVRLGAETAYLGWSAWLGSAPDADPSLRFLVQGRLHGQR